MARLNKNNFLVWDGDFDSASFDVIANNDSVSASSGAESVTVQPFGNDFATYGIDASSFTVVTHDNPSRPPVWNASTQTLTYYIPSGAASGTVTYRFRDTLGNLSNIATISVSVAARATSWVAYQPSKVCLKDSSNQNTGQAFFEQLQKVYSDTGSAVSPQELKANVEGEPDYIAPFADTASCPLPQTAVTYSIRNFTSNPNSGTIIAIEFAEMGGGVISSQNLNIRAGQNFTVNGPGGNISIRIGVQPHSGSAQMGYNMSLNQNLVIHGSNGQTYEFFDVNITQSVNIISFQKDV